MTRNRYKMMLLASTSKTWWTPSQTSKTRTRWSPSSNPWNIFFSCCTSFRASFGWEIDLKGFLNPSWTCWNPSASPSILRSYCYLTCTASRLYDCLFVHPAVIFLTYLLRLCDCLSVPQTVILLTNQLRLYDLLSVYQAVILVANLLRLYDRLSVHTSPSSGDFVKQPTPPVWSPPRLSSSDIGS